MCTAAASPPATLDGPGVPERLGDRPLRLVIVGHNPSEHAHRTGGRWGRGWGGVACLHAAPATTRTRAHPPPPLLLPGHYYSNPSNHMWSILKDSGIAPPSVRGAVDDWRMAEVGVGFTGARAWGVGGA